MIFKFYNHTPFVLAASPNVSTDLENREEATKEAAAAIFVTLYEQCDPRIYRHLKEFMSNEENAPNAMTYAKEVRAIAERVKEGEL